MVRLEAREDGIFGFNLRQFRRALRRCTKSSGLYCDAALGGRLVAEERGKSRRGFDGRDPIEPGKRRGIGDE